VQILDPPSAIVFVVLVANSRRIVALVESAPRHADWSAPQQVAARFSLSPFKKKRTTSGSAKNQPNEQLDLLNGEFAELIPYTGLIV
jgi:hypothetical protein